MRAQRIASLALTGLVLSIAPAGAATFQILMEGAGSKTFVADAGGGVASNPQIFHNGVLYDTPYPTSPPEYSPDGDPTGSPYGYLSGPGGGGYGWFWNSQPGDGCASLSCTIGFDFNGIYGEWFSGTGDMLTDTFGDGTGSGEYELAPIPLPAGLLLIVTGVAALTWRGRARRA